MKSDFLVRPVNLSREDRIKAHFMTCFIALLIYRILEKKLDYKYTTKGILDTTKGILDTLRNMNVTELKGNGYIPSYERTDITDFIHEKYNFNTNTEVITYKKIKKIFNTISK